MKLKRVTALLLAILALPGGLALAPFAHGATRVATPRPTPSLSPVPIAPEAARRYLIDEPGVLRPEFRRTLETLLIEHDRLAAQQVTIAIHPRADGDPADLTRKEFTRLKTGHGRSDGVLLAVFWKEKRSAIEPGFGLDSLLTEDRLKSLRKDILEPELRYSPPERALGLATLQLLTDLDSPLIPSGKAREILRSGGFTGSWTPDAANRLSPLWFTLPLLGIALFAGALMLLTAADAHFTGLGWYRPNPWWHYRRRFDGLRRGRREGNGPTASLGGSHGEW